MTITLLTGRTVTPPQLLDALNSLVVQCNAAIAGASISLFTGRVITLTTLDEAVNRLIVQINAAVATAGGSYIIPFFSHTQTADVLNVLNSLVVQINTAIATISTGYRADAVRFGGTQWLIRGANPFALANKPILMSIWIANAAADEGGGDMLFGSANQWFQSAGYVSFPDFFPQFNYYSEDYSNKLYGTIPSLVTGPTWQHLLVKMKTTNATLATAGQMVFNGVYQTQVGDEPFDVDGALPFNTVLDTDTDLFFGASDVFGASPLTADIAQAYLAYGDAADIDLSDPLNIAKFIVDGKPVDLLTSGAPEPLVLFDGDASTFGNNQGTGGSFTLTGTLTNASTSPSD